VILLVEDHSDSAEVFARMLKMRGHYVVTVQTAAATIRLLDSVLPSVIILDIGLPDRDGLDLLQQIRPQPRYALVPVVVFTADPTLKTLQRAKLLGVEHFFVKGTAKWETICDTVIDLAEQPHVRPLHLPTAAVPTRALQ
jgi:CheY-like chemotaxis protein